MNDIKLTDEQAKRLLSAIYEQPAVDELDIYDPGVVLEYHPAPDEEDEPEITDSQMLDWLSERFSHDSDKFNLLTLMDVGHKRSLRDAIRERMTDA